MWLTAIDNFTHERLIQEDWRKLLGNTSVEDIPAIIIELGNSDVDSEPQIIRLICVVC